MMQRDRPVFVMELASYVLEEHGKSLSDLLAYFTPLGYRFFDEQETRAEPLTLDEISQSMRDGAGINVIARAQ